MQTTSSIPARWWQAHRGATAPAGFRGRAAAAVLIALLGFASRARAQTPVPDPSATATLTPTPDASGTATVTPTPDASGTATVTPTPAVPDASPTASMTPSTVVTVVVTATPGTPTPTFTPTATPTTTATPTSAFNPAATPAPGGNVEVISKGDVHTTDGKTVGAGSFQIHNTSDLPDIIRQVRIEASEPLVFSSLTLITSSGTFTVTSPSADNVFDFQPAVEIAPNDTALFTLAADVSEDNSNGTQTPTPETTATSTTPTVTPTNTPGATLAGVLGGGGFSGPRRGGGDRIDDLLDAFGIGVVITGLLTALFGIGERRWRRLAGMSLVLLGIALYTGCGGEQTSRQTIAEITADNGLGPVDLTGVPADLGSVSRPQPLVFPGSGSTTTTGTAPSTGLTTLQ